MSQRANLKRKQIKIGISACLLGQEVRYDGGHKRQSGLLELSDFVLWIPVCPEVELGLGIPRETIGLYGNAKNPTLRTNHTDKELTQEMLNWSSMRLQQLEKEGIAGYVFKSRSPSCGLFVSISDSDSDSDGAQTDVGRGLFAQALTRKWPQLPIAEEEDLLSPTQREAFLERVWEYAASHGAVELSENDLVSSDS